MRRGFVFLLALIMLFSAMPISASAEEVTVEVSGSDCARDAGKLIVYTDRYGTSTGTNQWGVEAIVNRNHRVMSIVKGNAKIPEGGFVVSGHDNEEPGGKLMKTWIYDNVDIGDYVYFDRRTLTLTVSDTALELQSPFFSFDNPADAVDVERGDDQMILYTPDYGETTGTGEYGYEVVVEDNIVTKLGGNNSVIPKNGCVISLHGSTARWMRLKIVKGMTVDIDPETLNVVFSYSADGLKKAVTYSLDRAQESLDAAKKAFVYTDYDAAQATIHELRQQYDTLLTAFEKDGDENTFADTCDEIITQADTLCNALCESYTVQYRGVWLRPTQKTAKEVELYVKNLHENAVNFVCVEGWFENGVIMNVPEGSLIGRHETFDYDVLQAYIDACHKYDMELHLWMPIMCAGIWAMDGYDEQTVTAKREEWLSLNNLGMPYNKDNFMMLDPANEEARAYMMEFYKHIITGYDIDCFEMDYIRYYAANAEADFGYTEAAFAGFKDAYGYDEKPRYAPGADYWDDWCQYRRDCITEWVRDLRAIINENAPDMLLAADVGFPFNHALNAIYQDFPQWLEEGLIDILHPMAYGDGYGEEIKQAVSLAGDKCMVVTGLGAQVDVLGATELERQSREDNLYGAYGDCFFEAMTYLSDKIPDANQKTVYRNKAITPFLDVDAAVAACLDYMNGRLEDSIVPLGGMSEEEASAMRKAITEAKQAVKDGKIDADKHAALEKAIRAVQNEAAKTALLGDLYRTDHITCVKYKQNASELSGDGATDSDGEKNDSGMPVWVIILIGAAAVVLAAVVTVVIMNKLYPPKAKAKAEDEEPNAKVDEKE